MLSLLHAPPWIFQQYNVTTLWPPPPYVVGFTGWPLTKSSPPFQRRRLPALPALRAGCSAFRWDCCSGVRSSSRPHLVPARCLRALKTTVHVAAEMKVITTGRCLLHAGSLCASPLAAVA